MPVLAASNDTLERKRGTFLEDLVMCSPYTRAKAYQSICHSHDGSNLEAHVPSAIPLHDLKQPIMQMHAFSGLGENEPSPAQQLPQDSFSANSFLYPRTLSRRIFRHGTAWMIFGSPRQSV